jgi:iron complex outermembrane recepter protein
MNKSILRHLHALTGRVNGRHAYFNNLVLALVMAFTLVLSVPLQAQSTASAAITGKISNALTGRYLNNARVMVVETNQTVFTDEYGQFRLTRLAPGKVTLKVFYTGLDEQVLEVDVGAGGTVQKNIVLTNAARMAGRTRAADGKGEVLKLEKFVVEATEQDGDSIAINEQRFSPNLKNVVAADAFGDVTEGNPGEFLKFLPGVSVDYVAADVRSISVRGFGSAFTSVNVDGNRMASAASSGASRTFELEQVSMNNVARIELTKVPTPSMPADSMGGSVNLISKNAFEKDHREIKYRAYLSANSEDLTLSRTPGPKPENSYKIRPGFDVTYADPLTPNFGIVVNALRSDQFNEQHRSRNRWEFNSGDGTAATPYLRRYELQDGPKETLRQSLGINADWKVAADSVLSFGYQWNDYDSFFGNRNYTWNVGSSVRQPDYDGTFTQGRTRAGEITGATSFRNKFGSTNHLNLDFKHYSDDLTVLAGVFYSYATNKYRDISNGHFSNVGTRLRNLTIRFDGIQAFNPGKITALDTNGVDHTTPLLADFNLRSARSQEYDSWDEFKGGQASVKKSLNLSVPANIQVGVSQRSQQRDIIRRQDDYNYVGPDGSTESSDDNAAPFMDTNYVNQDPHYGRSTPQWINPYLVYQQFKAHPNYFVANVNNWQNRAQNDYNVKETISSAYVQGDAKLLDGKLAVLGGVRFAKTKIDGIGFRYDPNAIYNSSGQLITTDVYTQRRLQYQRRAQTASRDYDGYYPSLHFVYNFSDNLIARLAYARTLGRPDFSEILPGTIVDPDDNAGPDDPGGRITVRNTGLLPYEADNFDLSLEYYLKPSGVISIGAFQKNISNFFGAVSKLVDNNDLSLYNLDPEYLGWNLDTKTNSGSAKITGWEFNYQQPLTMLPSFAKDFSVFVNGTFLNLSGSNTADFRGFIEKTANWGVSYNGDNLGVMLKWNYRGEQVNGPSSLGGVQGYEYYGARTYLDLNIDYSFSKRLSVFFNARNLLNEPQSRLLYADVTPDYARTEREEEFGVQFAIGVKGTW